MAICRRSRVIKFIILTAFILGILLNVFPDEVETFFKQFVPPQIPSEDRGVDSPSNNKDSIKAERLHNPQPGKVQRHRSDHEPYLTPGNPGNFEPIRDEMNEGPGEGGVAYHLPASRDNEVDVSVSKYGINMAASNDISLDRSIPDTRMPECKNWHYPMDLPKASVVIVFHNEGRSVLLRTVHSIINRTPSQFLEEVLLVDDFSDLKELGSGLESYIKIFRGAVRLIRNSERQGLIRSRTRGAKEAKGVVVVFLDAHCEVNKNWLPPLLAPIYRNYTAMTVPIIDGVDHETFEYRPVYQGDTHFRGIFEWGMLYKETELPEQEASKREHNSEPYPSPTHAGGLFAINRQYFLSLGGYDPGLLVWGGENFELSFKIWQCGGSIQWVPCSRVGHVYRAFMPYGFGKLTEGKKGPIITINYKRVVETWMDGDYRQYFYTREPTAKFADMGDISEQLELKQNMECKSFDWYMKNVAYDMLEKYPKLPENVEVGSLVNDGDGSCLDTMGRQAPAIIGVSQCYGSGNGELVRLNAKGQLGIGERCIDATLNSVRLIFCPEGSVSGQWSYNAGQLKHKKYKTCLAVGPKSTLTMAACQNKSSMKWKFIFNKPRWA